MLGTLLLASLPAFAQARTWDFHVYLDDKPIGHHRFVLSEKGGERELTSTARFDVKFLRVPVYRYAHDATERWKGDCLVSLHAHTDDNGERSVVDREPQGCAMSFAYWNPAMLKRSQLLNAQTGELEAVSVRELGTGRITVRGQSVPATHYRISGPKHPIELWYSAGGEWLALESTVEHGRTLSYRLESEGDAK